MILKIIIFSTSSANVVLLNKSKKNIFSNEVNNSVEKIFFFVDRKFWMLDCERFEDEIKI
jgi:hypothetical protein